MANPTFTLTLDSVQFSAMAARLQAAGFGPEALEFGTLPETSGVLLGYRVTRVMDAAVVTFIVLKKPMLIPLGLIQARVKGMIGVA